MVQVKQVRVLRNVTVMGTLSLLVLWLVQDYLTQYPGALLIGVSGGILYGLLHWWQLTQKVARRDRRFERNKVFVSYLTLAEVALAGVAYNHYLAIPLGVAILLALLLEVFSAHWWTVLAGSFGAAGTAALAICLVRHERQHGPLYYQYDVRWWQGAEGMVYQVGKVVQRLSPTGKVTVKGELWNATSLSGETIEVGEQVEVLSIDGLTLHVDRISSASGSRQDEKRRA